MMSNYILFLLAAIVLVIVVLMVTGDTSRVIGWLSLLTFPFLLAYYYHKSLDRNDELDDLHEAYSSMGALGSVYLTPGQNVTLLDRRWEPQGTGPSDLLHYKDSIDDKILHRGTGVYPSLETQPQTLRESGYLGVPSSLEDRNRFYQNSQYDPHSGDLITWYGTLSPSYQGHSCS